MTVCRFARSAVAAGCSVLLVGAGAGPAPAEVSNRGGRAPDTVVVVPDPRRDAEGDQRVRQLSELTSVRYDVRREAGRLVVSARLAHLRRAGSGGAVNQHVGILLATTASCQDSWVVSVDNAGRRAMTYDDWCDDEHGRVRPDVLRVASDPGRLGVLRVVLSTELFENRAVEMRTTAQVGNGRAWDFTRFTRARRLG